MLASANIDINPNDSHEGTAMTSVNHRGKNVSIHCDTPEGAAFVEKYLHPPHPSRGEYCGIPDKNNSPSAHAQYDCVQQIQCVSETEAYNKDA